MRKSAKRGGESQPYSIDQATDQATDQTNGLFSLSVLANWWMPVANEPFK